MANKLSPYIWVLTLNIGFLLASCDRPLGQRGSKNERIFASSSDAIGTDASQPISSPVRDEGTVVLGAEPEEVKREANQDLPTGNDSPAPGTENRGNEPTPAPGPPESPAVPPSAPPAQEPAPFYPAQCAAIKKAQPAAPSGSYKIYLNPTDAANRVALDAYCDMTEDGGGWTLVLNYGHKADTNPDLVVLKDKLPLLAGDTLAVDESSNATAWGHASPAFLKVFQPKELRFYCRSSRSTSIVHFKSSDSLCLEAATSGIGNCQGVAQGFTALTGHSGQIPANVDRGSSDRGDFTLTYDTFGRNQLLFDAMWSIRGDTNQTSWECDFGSNTSSADTIHRVYFR